MITCVQRQIRLCPCGGHGKRYAAQTVRGRLVPERVSCTACGKPVMAEPASRAVLEICMPYRGGTATYRARPAPPGSGDWSLALVDGRVVSCDADAHREEICRLLAAAYLSQMDDWHAVLASLPPGDSYSGIRAALSMAADGQLPPDDEWRCALDAADVDREFAGDITSEAQAAIALAARRLDAALRRLVGRSAQMAGADGAD